ncbi:CDK5 regulatory subunit-associated protein 2 isoform X3 [Anguilla anguilla]|uniref:CDK5 regulatory subunit-associated protein 2 isoform X3 n=1 Tax=Anguilla anguilla TaxID=7936 RepID=UPI0015A84D2F|nr:CDK5 regulatory subunit-associated protein 2 isoform X3 [Anguilla anguilla]
MDSVVGEDQTLPLDFNGSTNMSRLPDSETAGGRGFAMETVTASMYPGRKMSPVKPLTMKDYENQITGLKKENFNLKLRIYFMEERMQQKFDDSTEDIFKTNIELKVEVESMKRDLAEKQELLVAASEALESLAGKESAEASRAKQQAQREIDQLKDFFNNRIQQLEENLKTAEDEVEKMASIAEQEKVRSIDMEKQLLAIGLSGTFKPSPTQDLHHALQEKNSIIEQLKLSLKNQESVIEQLRKTSNDPGTGDTQASEHISQLSALISQKDGELQALREGLEHEKARNEREMQSFADRQNEVPRLEAASRQLDEELRGARGAVQNLTKTLEDTAGQNKVLSGKLEEMEREMASEKKNALKRDKTIQGLTLVLKEKEKEIEELCHEIEDRDEALAKAREAAHKAQIQKYQGAEEHQSLLMEKQAELASLQLEHHTKALEAQKLQRSLGRREQELGDLQQAKEQLELELEDLQQLKKKGDKTINDLNNQLKKLNGEIGEREKALEQQYQALLDESKRKLQGHEVTIQRLTCTLSEKELQLQEYMKMLNEQQHSSSPGGGESVLAKLRQRLKDKEKALEQAMDEKFAAIEEKDDEIRQLRLSLREKDRELERLNSLLSHNTETINGLDALVKEKDAALQHQASVFGNLQRAKQELEENLARSLREKDSIIAQLQQSLHAKTQDLEDMSSAMLSRMQSGTRDLAEQLSQRLKVAEAMLAEALRDKERLVADNESAVDGLLATIGSKDQLYKESAERYNRALSERSQEIQDLRRQLSERQQQLASAEKQSSVATQEKLLETAQLKVQLSEKDALINKLVERGQERDQFLAELRLAGAPAPQVVELRQTIQVLQERLEEKEAELSKKSDEGNVSKMAVTKKTGLMLKKELEQKTEAFNKALKKENELRIDLADLRSLLTDLENRNEAQAANIESLTTTLETKDDIIWELQERLGRRDNSAQCGSIEERPRPGLPQRERTIIGGNSQQETQPSLAALAAEHEGLNRALKAEQQLYSSLVRAVKEQDSAQRLHALQMELAAVQLLRQRLEEGVRTNEDLRQDLEREIQRAKQREGGEAQTEAVDGKELESMRHQLEDAQRWNASLQARLGAIQSRGGGVGGTNDTADTFSFIADQTSYMSICVGDGLDELSLLSAVELRQKVVELQDYINKLQALNAELQKSASLSESSAKDPVEEEKDVRKLASEKHCERKLGEAVPANRTHHSLNDRESQSAAPEQVKCRRVDGSSPLSDSERSEGALLDVSSSSATSASHSPRGGGRIGRSRKVEREWSPEEQGRELALLRSLLLDSGVSSVSQLREEVQRLHSENIDLKGLLKEEKSTESKESADSSGDSDGNKDLQKVVEKLRSEAKGYRKVIKLLKEQLELNSSSGGEAGFNPELIVSMAREIERLKAEQEACRRRAESLERRLQEAEAQPPLTEQPHGSSCGTDASPRKNQHPDLIKHSMSSRSRLPIPVRPSKLVGSSTKAGGQAYERESQSLREESHLMEKDQLQRHGLPSLLDLDQQGQVGLIQQSSLWPDTEQPTDEHTGSAVIGQSTDVELRSQLELLHSECQDKEQVIARLQDRVAEAEELREQLHEKERLSRELVEALQAAESTIAYLTACNLGSQGGGHQAHDTELQAQFSKLQKALQEKEELNQQLAECLRVAESALASLGAFAPSDAAEDGALVCTDPQELAHKLERALQQASRPSAQSPSREQGSGPSAQSPSREQGSGPSAQSPSREQGSGPSAQSPSREQGSGPSAQSPSREQAEAGDAQVGDLDVHRQIDQLQEALWEQSRLNAELQERLHAAEQSTRRDSTQNQNASLCRQGEEPRKGPEVQNKEAKDRYETAGNKRKSTKSTKLQQQPGEPHRDPHTHDQLIQWLVAYLQAAERCVASLSALCAEGSARDGQRGLADLQQQLEKLQKAGQEKDRLHGHYSAEPPQPSTKPAGRQDTTKALQDNIGHIQKAFTESRLVISELQEALEEQKQLVRSYEDRLRAASSARGANVQEQLDSLQKALKEKKRTCKVLEEKLAAAQAIIALQSSPQKTRSASQQTTSLQQDDKEVQVDLQDLGYETSGKSENEVDREENSSTDNDLGLQLHASESNISSLLKQVRGAFSSVENLDSNSSVSYPSSPTLSSPKASLKGLQAFEDYGQTDSVDQLKQQVCELKGQLEAHQRAVRHLQSLLRRNSLSSDLLTVASDPGHSAAGKHDSGLGEGQEHASGALGKGLSHSLSLGPEEEELQVLKDQLTALSMELEKERSSNRNLTEQLQQIQLRSRSASPARIDSLVQSQARELSQLRQQIKESRGLGTLQRQQLEDLHKAFEELLQASDVDYYMGEVFREQLDKSLTLLERLEDRLENGDAHSDNEDSAMLELAQRESLCLSLDSPSSHHPPIGYLHSQLKGEREQLQQQLRYLVQQNQNLAEATKEQLDLLSKELQDKNRLVQSLQKQLRGQSASNLSSSDSEMSDRTPHSGQVSTYTTSPTSGHMLSYNHIFQGSGREGGVPCQAGDAGTEQRLQGLQKENSRLLEQLKSSEQLNETLRSELDLHCSILSPREQEAAGSPPPRRDPEAGRDVPDCAGPRQSARVAPAGALNPELLAEHLQEIRSLRQRLEETIRTNERLREQLERRLAEVEKDPAATNIFIHGTEEQGQLANELRFLWGQNQALKEQLSLGSRDKQKENEKLRESLARRTAKLEYLRNEFEALKKENGRLQSRLTATVEDNKHLQDSLHYSRDEIHRLQCEINVQRQQLMDNHQLLQSLRVELQVYEQIKVDVDKQPVPAPAQSSPDPVSGPMDLSELLSEIRHLRLQLERSIHTNNALRQKLEEQLQRGPSKREGSPSILINYLLSGEARAPAADDGTRPPMREGCDPYHPTPQGSPGHRDTSAALHEVKRQASVDLDRLSQCSGSSADSATPAPSRLVPGHRLWANKNGRHILGLIEDYNALRKQISEGRKLTYGMDKHLQECFRTLSQQDAESQVLDQQLLKGFSTNINTMQQVLEEAGRLLKLVWRVSLPSSFSMEGSQSHQDELLKNEIIRLKSRLSQQEKMLMGAVNRLRSTNQLKEGMEKVIIDQLSLTHGVLRKARGNLETNYFSRFGLKGLPGTTEDPSQWAVTPVEEGTIIRRTSTRSSATHSQSSEGQHSDTFVPLTL